METEGCCRVYGKSAGRDLFPAINALSVRVVEQSILRVNDVSQARLQLRSMDPLELASLSSQGVFIRIGIRLRLAERPFIEQFLCDLLF